MKKSALSAFIIIIGVLSCFGQINSELLEEMRTTPAPFDESRISYYINSGRLNPGDFEGYYHRGLLNLETGLYEEAVKNFRLLILPKPDIMGTVVEFAEPYFYLGLCKSFLLEFDSAMHFFNEAININPTYSAAYNERGVLHLNNGKFDKAMDDFEMAYMYDIGAANAIYNIGYTYFLMGDYKAARKNLKKAARRFPDSHFNNLLLGIIYMNESKLNKAIRSFSKAIEIFPYDPLAYFNRGLIKIAKGIASRDMSLMAEAKKDMDRVTQLDSTFVEAYRIKLIFGVMFGDPNSQLENQYLALKYSFSRDNYMASATPGELEKYYLLDNILNNASLPDEEKKLGEEFFMVHFPEKKDPIQSLLEYSRLEPNSLFIKRLIVYHYLNAGDTDQTEASIFSVLLMDSTLLHLKSVLAEIYMDQGMEQRGIAMFEKLLVADSLNGYLHYKAGNAYFQVDEFEPALKNYSRAIEIMPRYLSAYLQRAKVRFMEERLDEALEDVSTAIFINPETTYGWYLSGKIYNAMEKPDSALVMLNVAKELNPFDRDIYMEIAESYLALNRPEMAEEVFDEYVEKTDKAVYSYLFSGRYFLYSTEFTDKAEKYFSRALKLDPENAAAFNAMGDLYRVKKGDYHKAIEYYDQAVWYYEDYYSPVKNAAWCYYTLEQYEISLEYLDLAMTIDSAMAYPSYLKGFIYQKLENNEMALSCFLQAAEISDGYASAWGNAGWTCYLLGDYQKCIEYSLKAIELDDEAYYAMANIALTHLRLGEVEQALEKYEDYHAKVSGLEAYDNSGAKKDLEDLINEGIMVAEARNILETFFSGME